MEKKFDSLKNIESLILIVTGLVHAIFLLFFVDLASTPIQLYGGAMFFGVAYLFFGILIWRKVSIAFPIALLINVIGMIGAIVMFDTSPSKMIDPLLIVIDFISIPLLIYLNINRKKYLSS